MDRLRTPVYGTVLLLCIGWVLQVGKAIFVPAVLGVAFPVPMTVVQFEYLGAVLTIVFSGFPGTRPIAVLLSRNGRP